MSLTDIDTTIREIAATKGHTDLTPDMLHSVKQALANKYIDSILNGTKLASEDIDTDDDIMSDEGAEDSTDEKSEKAQRLRGTKEITPTPPTTPTSAPNTSGQTGMGQAG